MKKLSAVFSLLLFTPSLWGASEPKIRCSPKTLNLYDTLVVKLSLPHGEDFLIESPKPNRDEYWLSSMDDYHDKHSPTPYRARDFKDMSEIKLIPSQLKLVPFAYGRLEPELVFSKPGLYTIKVSTNAATDDGTSTYRCSVKFTNKHRK